jgi:hypothetical protein
MAIKGLDGWTTECFIIDRGFDPRIQLMARNGSLSVQGGDWPTHLARQLANEIIETCNEADAEFAANKETRK